MANAISRDEFARNLGESGLFTAAEIARTQQTLPGAEAGDGEKLAQHWVAAGKLTPFQAEAVCQRRFEELVIGNYQVLDRLGTGGMGTVYKARHQRMKRVVALKVLSQRAGASEHFLQRFQREVEAVACLNHPNIVMAHDAGEAAVGPFLVMEFVNGRDLATEVEQRGPLPVGEAVNCIVQAARGLACAHAQGIIHRDIKPANLLRDASGTVKVADLGLARFSGPSLEKASGLTEAGTVVGTVDFMSPEQAIGASNIDHRTDIYSLGCTLYFLLTGRPPYKGPSLMAILLKHRDAAVPSLCVAGMPIPAALDQVFAQMAAKKPEERFASMAEVIRALEGISLAPAAAPPSSRVTTVEFAAPQAASPSEPTSSLPAASQPARAATAVLLAEPSRTQSLIIQKYLQELGFAEVTTAPSGRKALESARNAPPGIVIAAMHLPDMTAIQLAQQMRAGRPLASTSFILISSQSDTGEADLHSAAAPTVHLHKPFDRAQLAAALAAAGAMAQPDIPGNLRALVVDDSAAARSHVRRVLEGMGASCIVEAADGAEARDLLLQQTFDLVITDYNMPRLDGRGLIEFIRRYSPIAAIPVIVMTTETNTAKLEAVRQLGVSAICDKNLQAEGIRRALGRPGGGT